MCDLHRPADYNEAENIPVYSRWCRFGRYRAFVRIIAVGFGSQDIASPVNVFIWRRPPVRVGVCD
jgi:hypothetical protein